MAVIVGLCIIFVRSLSVENPGKVQLLLESAIGKGLDFFEDIMGKENRKYIPYLITVLIYIGIANIIGLFGFKSPTKDLNVTAALAIMSMCLIEFSGIRKNGFKHWAAHFAKPVPFVAPIMVLEIVIRPLSLCMRLFGNVLGAFVIMELLKAVAPVLIPIPFSFYFDIFDGFLQAYCCSPSAKQYARVLYELGISKEAVGETEKLFEEVPVLEETFASPVVPMREKLSSIDKIFPDEIKNFLKVVCRNQRMSEISQILFAYDRYCKMQEGIQMATLTCVEAPDEKRLEKIREFLCEKYHKTDVKIEIVKDPALLGGFILKTGDDEYDWSLKGRLSRLEQKLTWR